MPPKDNVTIFVIQTNQPKELRMNNETILATVLISQICVGIVFTLIIKKYLENDLPS